MRFKEFTVEDCLVVDLPKVKNRAGNITSINGNKEVNFDIERVYYLSDIPGGENRGGHAHYELNQLLVAVSGSFEIILNDGFNERKIVLNRPNQGLLITPGIWRELVSFSSGAICMVLASMLYTESDYIRDLSVFIKEKQ